MIADDVMRAAVAKAVLEALPQEKRDALLVDAIKALVAPQQDHYGRATRSMLEEAFAMAARSSAVEIAREMFRSDPALRAMVQDVTAKAVAKMAEASDRIADALAEALEHKMREATR